MLRLHHILAGIALSFASGAPVMAQALEAPAGAKEENSGQDPTKPITRIDLRLKYVDNSGGSENQLLTLRGDKPFLLGSGWKLSTRADLPIVRSNVVTAGNLAGSYKLGVGDVLVQALFIAPPTGLTDFAFGTQLILPTGSDDQFTSGKWQLAPTAAVVRQLPTISKGTFVAFLVRDSFSFAGKNDRQKINVVSLQPIFNWQLPRQWFLTFSPEAKFNTRDNWKLFLPFDATVGRKIGPRTVVSLQGDVALIDEFKQYDWQVEFRVGFFL